MDKQAVHSFLYYRLRRPLVAGALRIAGWGLVGAWFGFAALLLALRYLVLPNVGHYQGRIEAAVTRAIGLPVRIDHIDANWAGLNPRLSLGGVAVLDRRGRQAFALERVEGVLSWRSLWHLRPMLASLAVDGPVLHVHRDKAGRISVGGVETEGESDPGLAEWVLAQPHIRIRDAIVVWEDELRLAPPLILEDLQLGIDNRGERHRFGLTAAPPAHLAARIDIRGEIRGSLDEALEHLSGRLFVELDYADLAGWRAWVDYPLDLPRGHGAVRFWGEWGDAQARLTADVALEDLRIRLGRELPELDLSSMRGRLAGRYRGEGWEVVGSKVELRSLDGIRITPTDFRIEWRHDQTSGRWSGSATASLLDLGALGRLADHLPLDRESREILATHEPQGRVAELRGSWESDGQRLVRYGLRARFDGLGMRAAGYFPGGEGLSGEVDASEKGGSLVLDSRNAGLDLPAVFPEPRLALGDLKARATWLVDGNNLDVRLDRLEFAGRDAAGSARGTYHYDGQGPGVIDLTASLSRADGSAVWRYLPSSVNADTRAWLQRGITVGTASDARLILAGDLHHFPFRDPRQGRFQVTAKARGVRIDYAPGWPSLEGVEADMSFGAGMRIEAHAGSILGTRIGPVLAEIPDFGAPDQMLSVHGQVRGPTSEFLRFIDQSPVGDKIERFTEEMRASGDGHLDLQFDMPLKHVHDTRVLGEYHFQNNVVTAVPGLPPLTQVNGRLRLTESSVGAPEITAHLLGGPMKLAVRNEADRIGIAIGGTANMREARKFFGWPLLDNVAGSTAWKGEIRVRKKSAEFVVESGLLGISSSLPEPLNKTAASALPLRVEKRTLDEQRDQIRISLGKVAEGLVIRRAGGEGMRIERGAVAVGEPLPALPERGVAAVVSVSRLDVDNWRRAFAGGNGAGGGDGASQTLAGIVGQVTVKTPSMRFLNRNYANVDLGVRPRDGGWQIALATREAVGELYWKAAGEGWLQADFKRLVVPPEAPAGGEVQEALGSLPGLDVRVADLAVGDKRLGRLEMKAHNEGSIWHLDNIALLNPDATLKGTGEWSGSGGHRTRLNFELAAGDLGKLLDRLGYAGAMKRGTAKLKGDLTWAGPLTAIHYPSLTGDLHVAAGKGQFARIEPGIGKLLGLLSLQSLPRRLSLDFRDIFSDGFAFDSIDAHLAIRSGVMRTVDDLRIDGPAARILMKGQADLRQETQDVMVTVQPEMGSVVSMGALFLANPVVGAAAAVANKILQNPLNKIFSFQYHVTGSWSDSKIEKVGQAVYDQPAPKAGEDRR